MNKLLSTPHDSLKNFTDSCVQFILHRRKVSIAVLGELSKFSIDMSITHRLEVQFWFALTKLALETPSVSLKDHLFTILTRPDEFKTPQDFTIGVKIAEYLASNIRSISSILKIDENKLSLLTLSNFSKDPSVCLANAVCNLFNNDMVRHQLHHDILITVLDFATVDKTVKQPIFVVLFHGLLRSTQKAQHPSLAMDWLSRYSDIDTDLVNTLFDFLKDVPPKQVLRSLSDSYMDLFINWFLKDGVPNQINTRLISLIDIQSPRSAVDKVFSKLTTTLDDDGIISLASTVGVRPLFDFYMPGNFGSNLRHLVFSLKLSTGVDDYIQFLHDLSPDRLEIERAFCDANHVLFSTHPNYKVLRDALTPCKLFPQIETYYVRAYSESRIPNLVSDTNRVFSKSLDSKTSRDIRPASLWIEGRPMRLFTEHGVALLIKPTSDTTISVVHAKKNMLSTHLEHTQSGLDSVYANVIFQKSRRSRDNIVQQTYYKGATNLVTKLQEDDARRQGKWPDIPSRFVLFAMFSDLMKEPPSRTDVINALTLLLDGTDPLHQEKCLKNLKSAIPSFSMVSNRDIFSGLRPTLFKLQEMTDSSFAEYCKRSQGAVMLSKEPKFGISTFRHSECLLAPSQQDVIGLCSIGPSLNTLNRLITVAHDIKQPNIPFFILMSSTGKTVPVSRDLIQLFNETPSLFRPDAWLTKLSDFLGLNPDQIPAAALLLGRMPNRFRSPQFLALLITLSHAESLHSNEFLLARNSLLPLIEPLEMSSKLTPSDFDKLAEALFPTTHFGLSSRLATIAPSSSLLPGLLSALKRRFPPKKSPFDDQMHDVLVQLTLYASKNGDTQFDPALVEQKKYTQDELNRRVNAGEYTQSQAVAQIMTLFHLFVKPATMDDFVRLLEKLNLSDPSHSNNSLNLRHAIFVNMGRWLSDGLTHGQILKELLFIFPPPNVDDVNTRNFLPVSLYLIHVFGVVGHIGNPDILSILSDFNRHGALVYLFPQLIEKYTQFKSIQNGKYLDDFFELFNKTAACLDARIDNVRDILSHPVYCDDVTFGVPRVPDYSPAISLTDYIDAIRPMMEMVIERLDGIKLNGGHPVNFASPTEWASIQRQLDPQKVDTRRDVKSALRHLKVSDSLIHQILDKLFAPKQIFVQPLTNTDNKVWF
jgi:hypothetical protein